MYIPFLPCTEPTLLSKALCTLSIPGGICVSGNQLRSQLANGAQTPFPSLQQCWCWCAAHTQRSAAVAPTGNLLNLIKSPADSKHSPVRVINYLIVFFCAVASYFHV